MFPHIEVSRDYHLGIDLALFALPPVREKPMSDEKLRALPKDVPDYHARQAAHLRALAENATTARLKARLARKNTSKSAMSLMPWIEITFP